MSPIWNALVNASILSAALAAALWIGLRLTPRHALNAATRYVVWWAALLITAVLPLLCYSLRPKPHPESHALVTIQLSAFEPIPAPPTPTPVAVSHTDEHPIPHRNLRPPLDALSAILLIWILLTALLLGRLAVSYILLDRRRARAWAPPAHLRTRAQTWLSLCGTTRPVRLAASSEISVPIAVGPRRPSILIPARMLRELGDDDLDRVGLHEAAHLARRDDYALLLQRFLEAVFAAHPVVRWIASQIDLEREVACDDFVIAAMGRARSYADCLTRMVEICGCVRPSLSAATMADDLSHLARRVEMLLDRTRHTGTRLLKLRLTAIVAALACLAWFAGKSPAVVAFAKPLARALVPIVYAPAMAAQAVTPAPESPRDLEGRVVEDSSGNPLATAELRFHRAGLRELAADLDTDREGRFHAPGLPPGDYTIDVAKPHFITTTFRLRVPASHLQLRLVRYAVLDGQATDAEGRPLPGRILAPGGSTSGSARVAVLVRPPGSDELRPFRETELTDDGRYRVHDLPPGQYAVGLWYAGLKNGSGVHLYPDNQHPRFFTVAGGEEYRDINFTVLPRSGFGVSGKVQSPKSGMRFALALGVPEQPTLPIAQTLSEPDGTFHFENIAPGQYDLFAAGPQAGYGAFDFVLGPDPLYGRTRVQVGAANVEGLDVAVASGPSFAVVLRGQGSGPLPDGCPRNATVIPSSLEPWGVRFENMIPVAFGKEQTIRNLAPGRFRLSTRDLGGSCYQVSQPTFDLRSELTAPVAVELAAAGSIRGTWSAAIAGTALVLRNAEAADTAQTRLSYPDPDGRFTFEALPPGRYRLAAQTPKAAWHDVEVRGGAPTTIEVP